MFYQIIAIQSGGRTKSIINKSESDVLVSYVIPFIKNGVLTEKWGDKNISYQVLELKIYKTADKWDKKSGKTLDDFISGSRNQYSIFQKKAEASLAKNADRVFVVTPIQGNDRGTQEDQRIFREYNSRFEAIERLLQEFNCVAIRIDKEFTIKNLAERIRDEIGKARFIIADLTDERPSCYYEVGYAEALSKPVIYMASENSVIDTKAKTKIHFDIHHNIHKFSSVDEMAEKLRKSINKNRDELLG